MANKLINIQNLAMHVELAEQENTEEVSKALYAEFETAVSKLFFNYVKEEDQLSKHDFHAGVIGKLRGKEIHFGKYGSLYLTKTCQHKIENFNLKGLPIYSKLLYLTRKASFPIKYTVENSKILESIYESIDKDIPLRKLVRNMISEIKEEWDVTYSSLYLSALRYVYATFLSHSDKDTTFSVTGNTYRLLLDPWSQDYIKDYPLYQYRLGTVMFQEGHDWLASPEFEEIQDEPSILFCTPWDYEVEDYKYAFEPYDKARYVNELKELEMFSYLTLKDLKVEISSIDISNISKYMNDSSYFKPEDDLDRTHKKVDDLTFSMLTSELMNPTIKSMEFIRKQIYVSPNNIRDTFIPSWKTFCALFTLESLCDKLIPKIPEIRIGKVNSELKFNHSYYVMIDVKKFGIMFPKEVILAIIGSLERVFKIDLDYIKRAYENYILYIDGSETYPERGFGLGNLNKLATIAHYMIAKQSNLKFYVYSDDIVYMLDKKPDDEVLSSFERFYNTFGLILNKKKCYISTCWEFLGESNHEFFDYVENARCITAFNESFFSKTLLEGELREKAALRMYTSSRDLFLKNHEIRPILREDLIIYPESMGGFVCTNTPLSYCDEGDLTPSTLTSIRPRPGSYVYRDLDDYYSSKNAGLASYYLDSVVRHFHPSERRKMNQWKELSWWKSEERRYRNAPISNLGYRDVLSFGIKHLDLPDRFIEKRTSPSQIKGFMKVPKVFKRGVPMQYVPIVSIRDSDRELLNQLSDFTEFPIYTKYMLELKKKCAIKRIRDYRPLNTCKYLYELALNTYMLTCNLPDYTKEIERKDEFEILDYEELDFSYFEGLSQYREDVVETKNDILIDLDDLQISEDLLEPDIEDIELDDDLDLEDL